nr:citrate synthase [Desulfobulbaceae bacterium]
MARKQIKEAKRASEGFNVRTVTKIWNELPSSTNPYLAEKCLCHGYDQLELIQNRGYVDVLYLLFTGELPTRAQGKLLETLMVALINLGPRNPATRAGMNAAVSRTKPVHLLPISLSVLSGKHLGAEEVEESIRFFRKNMKLSPDLVANTLLMEKKGGESDGDWHIAPGFGSRFGGIDPLAQEISLILSKLSACGPAIKWGNDFVNVLKPHEMGWLSTGLAGAVLCDLGLPPRAGGGLYQIMCAPGLLAHSLEMLNKPISSMPFLDEKNYVIDEAAGK